MTNLSRVELNLEAIISSIKQALPQNREKYPLHEPWFCGKEWEYLKECLDSNWISSAGPFVGKFEKNLADYTGIPYAVAVMNGTAALHLALQLAEVGPEDEVLIPSLTFIATANAVRYTGALPHFADIEWKTLGLDAKKLALYLNQITERRRSQLINQSTGRRIKALICMHTFGHPSEVEALQEVCAQFGLVFIEDAAEAMGSKYRGSHVGRHGKMAVLSFNGNKTITTGGGGALLTQDKALAERARHLSTTAKIPHPWEIAHDEVGYNYRMPNINAALGLAQLENLDFMLSKKRELARRYEAAFQSVKGLKFFKEPPKSQSNNWLNTVILEEDCAQQLEDLLSLCHAHGILSRPAWHLIHDLPMYRNCPKMDLSVSKSAAQRLMNLPSSGFLGES